MSFSEKEAPDLFRPNILSSEGSEGENGGDVYARKWWETRRALMTVSGLGGRGKRDNRHVGAAELHVAWQADGA